MGHSVGKGEIFSSDRFVIEQLLGQRDIFKVLKASL